MARPSPLRAELRALIRLAVPLALAAGGQSLMGLVDTAVVGRAGAVPLAAAGLGNSLFFAIAVLGMGVMHGVDPLVSQALGAGDALRARRFLWQGLWLAGAAAAVLAVPIAVAPALLAPIGIEPEVARQASGYLLWRLPGLPLILVYFVVRAYLQAHGYARPMLVATAIANVVNFGLDLLLVFGGATLPAWTGPLRSVPALGVTGSAIATSLSLVLQTALLGLAVSRVGRPRHARVDRRPDRTALREALRVGAPIGLHMGAEVGIFALVSLLAGRLGAEAMAAHQLALSIASITFTVAIGFGEGGSVRVGRAVGARDRAGARRAGLAAFACGASLMSMSGLAFLLAPEAIARAMTDDPGVVATAAPLLRVAALFQISDGIQGVGAGVLRGAGETRFTFLANVLGHWAIGLPACLLLGFGAGLGIRGLWGGLAVGLTAVAASLLGRFLRISSREIVPLAELI